jgi:hypothetical protein
MLLNHPAMEPDPVTPSFELRQWDGTILRTTDWIRFRSEIDPASAAFETGDDTSGDQAHMAAAAQYVPSFGVATECCWGRGDPARIPALLASHRHAMEH